MSLATNVSDFATAVATKIKETRTLVNGNAADLSLLTTTTKTNLVAAISEVHDELDSVAGSASGINDATASGSTTWSSTKITTELAGKADTSHTHSTAQVTGLDAALAGKAATSHTHTASNITDFTAEVDERVQLVVGAAPANLDTLQELAAALTDNDSDIAGITTALSNRVRVDDTQSLTGTQQGQARTNIAAASQADLDALVTAVGDTTTNFVTTFEAGLLP